MQIAPEVLRKCWFLTGPTACGKTETSLLLAEHLNAEIIALDSMSLYRGMDIGTAKPSQEQQALKPHHLIDIRDPNESYSVSEYRNDAITAAEEIERRGRRVPGGPARWHPFRPRTLRHVRSPGR